jgi:hypothetical protein
MLQEPPGPTLRFGVVVLDGAGGGGMVDELVVEPAVDAIDGDP